MRDDTGHQGMGWWYGPIPTPTPSAPTADPAIVAKRRAANKRARQSRRANRRRLTP